MAIFGRTVSSTFRGGLVVAGLIFALYLFGGLDVLTENPTIFVIGGLIVLLIFIFKR